MKAAGGSRVKSGRKPCEEQRVSKFPLRVMTTTTAAAVPNHDACAAYAALHTPAVESALSHAVDACFAVQADEPLRFIAD